ncbi:hypothetical protein EYC84_009201 [Monilinia fructicola]|uniref:Uncharacterized protein n=1 Tax=Monilinia fructicola TaxID=38448 RepID=A0A5M9JE76_MONFR|nr:hypothetical protein EYC84_009201 [Monilinia fructicola]
MLSNPTNNLQNRHRQHRRQNSTPTAFDAVKANNLPPVQRHAHRRGMSLDTRPRPIQQQDQSVTAETRSPGPAAISHLRQ